MTIVPKPNISPTVLISSSLNAAAVLELKCDLMGYEHVVLLVYRLFRQQRSWKHQTAGSAASASATCRPTRSWTSGLSQRCLWSTSSAFSSLEHAVTSLTSKLSSHWRIGICQITCHIIRYTFLSFSGVMHLDVHANPDFWDLHVV